MGQAAFKIKAEWKGPEPTIGEIASKILLMQGCDHVSRGMLGGRLFASFTFHGEKGHAVRTADEVSKLIKGEGSVVTGMYVVEYDQWLTYGFSQDIADDARTTLP